MDTFPRERIVSKPPPEGVKPASARAALDFLRRHPNGYFWCLVVEVATPEGPKQGVIHGDRYNQLWKQGKWRRLGYRVVAVYVRWQHVKSYKDWNGEYLLHVDRAIPFTVPVVRVATRGELRRGEVKERTDDKPRKSARKSSAEVIIP